MQLIARVVLFTSNFIFFISGVLQLSFGIVGIANPEALANFIYWIPGVQSVAVIVNVPELVVSSSTYMIVVGSCLVVFGFLGCAGVVFNSKWMLFLYWVLLSILLLVEISLLIFAAVNPSLMQAEVQAVMYRSLHKHFAPVSLGYRHVLLPSHIVAVAWVSMQFEVGCCGVMNYTDYQTFHWNNSVEMPGGGDFIDAVVPPSCCKLRGNTDVPKEADEIADLKQCLLALGDAYYIGGCYFTVQDLMVQYSYVPIGLCCSVIVVQCVAIAMAIYLWKSKEVTKEGAI